MRFPELTQRETDVAILVADGLRSRTVAEILDISPRAVDRHVLQIYKKLEISNRVQLMLCILDGYS